VALWKKDRFIFLKVLRGWLADLICRVSAVLNEHTEILVNPCLHIINMRVENIEEIIHY